MNRQLANRLESVSSSESERLHNFAALNLVEIDEQPHNWSALLGNAREELIAAMEIATNAEEYFRSRLLYETSALYSLPSLIDTVSPGVRRKGIVSVRRSIVGVIDDMAAFITANRDPDMGSTIFGLANEAAILAALTHSDLLEKGVVAVPSLPWHDRTDLAPLQFTAGKEELDYNNSFDIALLPITQHAEPRKVQVKSGVSAKKYTGDIVVINCAEILTEVLKNRPPDIREPQSNHLYRLLLQPKIEQSDSAARAIYAQVVPRLFTEPEAA